MSHRFRDDIKIRHQLVRPVILMLQEADEHVLRLFNFFRELSCVHLGTHLVYAGADELCGVSLSGGEPTKRKLTSAIIYFEFQTIIRY